MSAHDYDDRPLSSPRSLVDLSPSLLSLRSRVRSGSLGAEEPERSGIPRINTDLTVRQNIHFQQLLTDRRRLPSLAPTCDSQGRRLAASDNKCAILSRTFYFHLFGFGSRDSRRHKSTRIRKARLFGYARRPPADDELSASPGPCGPGKKVSKADPVVRRDALPSIRIAPVAASTSFSQGASLPDRTPLSASHLGVSAKHAIRRLH
jgi:hypothetical protein